VLLSFSGNFSRIQAGLPAPRLGFIVCRKHFLTAVKRQSAWAGPGKPENKTNKKAVLMKKKIVSAAFGAAALGMTASAASAATLDDVKAKDFVQCGVSQGLPGFSNPDSDGNWTGIDVDLCNGVAAAVFGDASKVKFVPLSAKERFTALQSGEVDLLSRNTTWTMSRDTTLGLNFAGVNYYDGQGFICLLYTSPSPRD